MKKYRVYGTTVVTVVKEVWANNENEAIEEAFNQLSSLTEYCGNGGYDKLVGVDGDDESVSADDDIRYDDIEFIEENDEVCKCPECGYYVKEIEMENDGKSIWYCDECDTYFDKDGNIYDEYELNEEDEE